LQALRESEALRGGELLIASLDVFAASMYASHLAAVRDPGDFPPNGVLHVDLMRSWDNPTDARLAQSLLEAVVAAPAVDSTGGCEPVFVLISNDNDYEPLLAAVRSVAPRVLVLRVTMQRTGVLTVT